MEQSKGNRIDKRAERGREKGKKGGRGSVNERREDRKGVGKGPQRVQGKKTRERKRRSQEVDKTKCVRK